MISIVSEERDRPGSYSEVGNVSSGFTMSPAADFLKSFHNHDRLVELQRDKLEEAGATGGSLEVPHRVN